MSLSWTVILPFAGLLLSVALGPVQAPAFWHKHMGKVVVFWSALSALLCSAGGGPGAVFHLWTHVWLAEYIPFVVLVLALYTVAGGIGIHLHAPAYPLVNTLLLALGTLLAGWIGTMAASMIFLRPFLALNRERTRRTHHILFFVFLVGNTGGLLTPLGDPPLFVGYLNGVDFFWPLHHLGRTWLWLSATLLGLFALADAWAWHTEKPASSAHPAGGGLAWSDFRISISGRRNLFCLAAVVGVILASAGLRDKSMAVGPVTLAWFPGLTEILLAGIALLSWTITPRGIYEHNGFGWEPAREVAVLFAGIFTTLAPVSHLLHTPEAGQALSFLQKAPGVWDEQAVFWTCGAFSALLDNAPTYLLFFHMAGGDAASLMVQHAPLLKAISLGAVLMGALTWIGNAPNMMIRAVAVHARIHPPSFLMYSVWAAAILGPLFVVVSRVSLP